MPERIPQSATIRVPLQAYLASDHISPATGKTIAVTISKNGAAYGNPSGGATNATEIANGSYYVDLSATDTGTLGPLFVRGAVATVDDVIAIYNVVAATNGGLTALPNAAAEAAGGLYTRGTGAGQIAQDANGRIDANVAAISTDATAADNLETMLDGTGGQTFSLGHLNVVAPSDGLAAVVLTGGNASGATPGGSGLQISGGSASTTGGGVAGNGMYVFGGTGAASTNGNGVGAIFAGGTAGGAALTAGHGIQAIGVGNAGAGIQATASGFAGVQVSTTGTNQNGLQISANGTGSAVRATGGATGPAVSIVGGGTSGNGINVTTTSGDGISVTPTAGNALVLTANGTSKHGAVVTGGTAGTSDGIKAVAGTGGVDIRGAITGNVTGNLSGSVGSVTGAVGSVTGLTASDVGAIKTKTDFLPSATAGAAGGVFIAGSNAATTVNFTGNLSGSVGSVTGAVGSVTGLTASDVGNIKTKTDFLPSATAGSAGGVFIAGSNAATTVNITGNLSGSVGSVSGNVGGNVTGSVGSVASGGIAAASFAADAITAAVLAADVTTELQNGLATATAVSTLQTSVDDLPTNSELATALSPLALEATLGTPTGASLSADIADLPTAIENADAVLTRDSSNWEASAPVMSLGTAVMKATHKIAPTGATLQIFRSNGSTVHAEQVLTTDATLDPIKEVAGATAP